MEVDTRDTIEGVVDDIRGSAELLRALSMTEIDKGTASSITTVSRMLVEDAKSLEGALEEHGRAC
jgi:hypothetical protein